MRCSSRTASALLIGTVLVLGLFSGGCKKKEQHYDPPTSSGGIFSTQSLMALSVSKTGSSGKVVGPNGLDCGSSCVKEYSFGQVVTLSATPLSSNDAFTGWSGAGCSGTGDCQFTMDGDKTVNASFGGGKKLSVSLSGTSSSSDKITSSPGGINCTGYDSYYNSSIYGKCSSGFAPGSSVTLTPSTGSYSYQYFMGWSGGGCSGASPCTVLMDGDKSVTATFGSGYKLTVNKAGTAYSYDSKVTSAPSGLYCYSSSCYANFSPASSVVLTASATASSAYFAGWSGGVCSGTSATCSVSLSADTTVTATFNSKPQVTVTVGSYSTYGNVTSSPAGINCGNYNYTCSAYMDPSSSVTLTPTPAAGRVFTGWSGACSGTGSCTLTVDANKSVTANFQ
ncbi:MAG: hypothetical protein HY548_05050 [Elusimicrobia bacterium]|nr:hypothetical protein [Elusimicrobiota bacterium]